MVVAVELFTLVVHLGLVVVLLLVWITWVLALSLAFFVEVHIVHVLFCHWKWILFVKFLHHLDINLVMHLESLGFDLQLPSLVVDLYIVQNGVHKGPDVGVFVAEQLKDYGNHLGLVQHDVSGGTKEQELEESIKDLLNHFIILLFGTQ